METTITQLQTQTDKLPKADVPIDKDYYVCRSTDNIVYTTSFGLARAFNVEHKNMLRSIRNIMYSNVPQEFLANFIESEYKTPYGRTEPCIVINYIGYVFFCMNYYSGNITTKVKILEIMTKLENCIRNAYNADIDILFSKIDTLKTTTSIITQVNTPKTSNDRRRFINQALAYADQALKYAQNEIEELDTVITKQTQEIKDAQPAIEFAKAMSNCDDTILVSDLANNISQMLLGLGYEGKINQYQLYAYLRDKEYVSKQKGMTWNKPRVKSIRDGLLKSRENVYTDADGKECISFTTGVTGKGQIHFMDEILQIYKNGGTI